MLLFNPGPTGASMPSPSLPARSLRTAHCFPAGQALSWTTNLLICIVLWSIRGAGFGAESRFVPATRERRPPADGWRRVCTRRQERWMGNAIAGIDHAIVGVRDLEGARTGWSRLGFTLAPRGRHIG